MQKVWAIFDIGKSNKKFFLFDENYQVVYQAVERFDEVEDEDGFPADNLPAIEKWMMELFSNIIADNKFLVKTINFSAYGASFVHIGHNGKPITPLYNYLKSYPKTILESFYKKYGSAEKIAKETASPALGMLNSGLQLYLLKYAKPELFKQIKWSIHLPSYFSFLFTGKAYSEYTSIGCHTALWDYRKGDYHQWIYEEEIDHILPPIAPTSTSIEVDLKGKKINVGIGIHDSSAALLPFIKRDPKPFLLISTGTWSITLNPFNNAVLSQEELEQDCLQYIRPDGQAVKASRLFLGNEYQLQVKKLCFHFDKKEEDAHLIRFDENIYKRLNANFTNRFHLESISRSEQPKETNFSQFATLEEALHQLLMELVDLQIQKSHLTIGTTLPNNIYIDGGFVDNDIYTTLLSRHFKEYSLFTTKSPIGSALGAAIAISDKQLPPASSNKYGLKIQNL